MDKRWLSAAVCVVSFFPALNFSGFAGITCIVIFCVAFLATFWFILEERMASVSKGEPMILPTPQELHAMKQAELERRQQSPIAPVSPVVKPQEVLPIAKPVHPSAPITGRAVFNLGTDQPIQKPPQP